MNQYYALSYTDEFLAHHGILGQKWGKKNGPPYPLDPAKDYSAAEKRLEKAQRRYERASAVNEGINNFKNSTKEERLGKVSGTLKDAKKVVDTANQINNSIPNRKAKSDSEDVSKMTDAELRQKVNRMQMEQQYSQLSQRDVKNGSARVREILQSAGAVIAVSGAAIDIYLKLKGK